MKICKCDICKQQSITRRVYDNGIKYICNFCINVGKYDTDTDLDSDLEIDSSGGLLDYLDKKTSSSKRKSDTILNSMNKLYYELERKWNNYWFVPLCDRNAYLKKII